LFKRSLLGYRRAEVDTAIAARDSALDDAGTRLVRARELIDVRDAVIDRQKDELVAAKRRIVDLERVATKLSERVVERERELKIMRAELSELNASSDQGMKALVAVAAELDAMRGQARGQATRIRMQALSEAAELSDKLSAIAQRPVEVREALVAALTEALGQTEEIRLGDQERESAAAAQAEDASHDLGVEPEVEVEVEEPFRVLSEPIVDRLDDAEREMDPISELAAEVEAAVGKDSEPVVIATGGAKGDARVIEHVHPADLFNGTVEVEIGPLDDFAQLVGFEDAASGIAGASDISVKRFAKGRATLEMRIDEPIELLRELEGKAPFGFSVRDTREDRVILDLDSE
jgi:hypothetical protein